MFFAERGTRSAENEGLLSRRSGAVSLRRPFLALRPSTTIQRPNQVFRLVFRLHTVMSHTGNGSTGPGGISGNGPLSNAQSSGTQSTITATSSPAGSQAASQPAPQPTYPGHLASTGIPVASNAAAAAAAGPQTAAYAATNAATAVPSTTIAPLPIGMAPVLGLTPEQLAAVIAALVDNRAVPAPSKANLPAINSNLNVAYLVHDVPKEILKSYWKRAYISLRHLTNQSLERFSHKPPVASRKLFAETASAGEESYGLDVEDERGMLSIMQFDEGTRNWLRVIDIAHPNDEGGRYTMWCELERFIREYPDRASHHKALVKYWSFKMRLYASVGDDPSTVHQQVLDRYIMDDVIASSVAAATQASQFSPKAHHAGPYWPNTGGPSSPTRGGFSGAARGSTRGRIAPRGSFRGVGGAQSGRTCIICGGADHWASSCTAASQVNGRALYLSRTSDGNILNPAGQSVCYKFNNGTCAAGAGCNRAHECSGCGATQHGRSARVCV